MKRKYKYGLSIVVTLLASAISFGVYSHFASADLSEIKDSSISPKGPAQKQTLTIPVGGTADPNPGVIWQQLDDKGYIATSELRQERTGYGGALTPSNTTYPDPPVSMPIVFDMTNYRPTAFYDKDAKHKYNFSDIDHKGVFPGSAEYKDSLFYTPVDQSPTIIPDSQQIRVTVKTGGPVMSDQGTIPETGKRWVRYDVPLRVQWLGNVTQTKEIHLTGPNELAPEAVEPLETTVTTFGYEGSEEGVEVDVTQRSGANGVTYYESADPGVVDVDPQTGVMHAKGLGKTTITVHFEKEPYNLVTTMDVEVKEDPIDDGQSDNGYGKIVFTPDNTNGMELPIVRNWARHDFQVTAKVVDYKRAEQTKSVSWKVPCTSAEKRQGRCPSSGYKSSGSSNWMCYREKEPDIIITGSFSGTNSVMINKEGNNHKLDGRVGWQAPNSGWKGSSPPSRAQYTTPSCTLDPPDITGHSGIYLLDKTPPVQVVSPVNRSWTNLPFTISIKHSDNLSGFYGTQYTLENISYYNSGNLQGFANNKGLSWEPVITINQNGVYTLETKLGDWAGWPEVLPDGPQTYKFVDYRFDNVAPYQAQYEIGDGGVVKDDGVFDYIADSANTVKFRVGDDLSGVVKTQISWSKSNDLGKYKVNDWKGDWVDVPVTTPDYATGANQMSNWVTVNLNSKTGYSKDEAKDYDDLKEGTWYLHVRQTDRAGNVTQTASPPIFVNKVKNLRISNVADFGWKSTFVSPVGQPTGLAINGIGTDGMAVYQNNRSQTIALGYGVDYKLDSIGFDGEKDRIVIKAHYHGLDQDGKLWQDDDVYVTDDNGKYVKLGDSKYAGQGDVITFSDKYNKVRRGEYESSINDNRKTASLFSADSFAGSYATWKHRIFLPSETIFLHKGGKFNISGRDTDKFRVLVTFTIDAYREGHTKPLQYTLLEDTWASGDTSYGKKKNTGKDLLKLGVNHGEFVWFNLMRTAKDDLKYYREW